MPTLQIARRTTGDSGPPTDLRVGELFANYLGDEDGQPLAIYIGASDDVSAPVLILGRGRQVEVQGDQTITGKKSFRGQLTIGQAAETEYAFPIERGSQGQTLVLDNAGNLVYGSPSNLTITTITLPDGGTIQDQFNAQSPNLVVTPSTMLIVVHMTKPNLFNGGAGTWGLGSGQTAVASNFTPLGAAPVATVFGRAGAVVGQLGDYTATLIALTTIQGWTSTQLQQLAAELTSEFGRVEYTSSGIFRGGVLSKASATTVAITAGVGIIVQEAANRENRPISTLVTWAAQTITIANLTSQVATYLTVSSAGAIVQSATMPTASQLRSQIFLGCTVNWTVGNQISSVMSQPNGVGGLTNDLRDFIRYTRGPISITKGKAYPGVGFQVSTEKLSLFGLNVNLAVTSLDENTITLNPITQLTFDIMNPLGATITKGATSVPKSWVSGTTAVALTNNDQATLQRLVIYPSGYAQLFLSDQTWATREEAIGEAQAYFDQTPIPAYANETGALLAVIAIEGQATSLGRTRCQRPKSRSGRTGSLAPANPIPARRNGN
jgi:hypothetical protein